MALHVDLVPDPPVGTDWTYTIPGQYVEDIVTITAQFTRHRWLAQASTLDQHSPSGNSTYTTNGYLQLPATAFDPGTGPFSIELWVNEWDTGNPQVMLFATADTGGPPNPTLIMELTPVTTFNCQYSDGLFSVAESTRSFQSWTTRTGTRSYSHRPAGRRPCSAYTSTGRSSGTCPARRTRGRHRRIRSSTVSQRRPRPRTDRMVRTGRDLSNRTVRPRRYSRTTTQSATGPAD